MDPTFYDQPTEQIAQALLGCYLAHDTIEGVAAGMIIETEAYLSTDPASHSFRGPTIRNANMFGPHGHAYVYLSYGLHWCLNIVTAPVGVGEAVLIRALAPTRGIALMQSRRGAVPPHQLSSGPGKLTTALGITGTLDGVNLTTGPLKLYPPSDSDLSPTKRIVVATPRIGITRGSDLLLRYVLK